MITAFITPFGVWVFTRRSKKERNKDTVKPLNASIATITKLTITKRRSKLITLHTIYLETAYITKTEFSCLYWSTISLNLLFLSDIFSHVSNSGTGTLCSKPSNNVIQYQSFEWPAYLLLLLMFLAIALYIADGNLAERRHQINIWGLIAIIASVSLYLLANVVYKFKYKKLQQPK